MNKKIILICGAKSCGKSTTSRIFQLLLPMAKEKALADKLKDTCAKVYDIPRNTFDDQKLKEFEFKHFNIKKRFYPHDLYDVLKEYNISYDKTNLSMYVKLNGENGVHFKHARHIAQFIGTEVLRTLGGEDVHCKAVDISSEITIIPDVRFMNEYNYFMNLAKTNQYDVIAFCIRRTIAEEKSKNDSHESERGWLTLADHCVNIDNNGTIEDLEINIQQFYDKYMKDNAPDMTIHNNMYLYKEDGLIDDKDCGYWYTDQDGGNEHFWSLEKGGIV